MPYRSYDAVIGAIYDAAAQPQAWPGALEQIADYVGGSGAMLAYSDFRRHDGTIVIGRLREDLSQLYLENYTSNPLSEAIARRRITAPVLGSALADHAALRRSAMHADVLHPQRITDQAMVGISSLLSKHGAGGFSVTLSERQAEQAPDILKKLRRLTPHLSRAVEFELEIARDRDGARGRAARQQQPRDTRERCGRGAVPKRRRTAVGADRRLCAPISQDDRRLRGLLAEADAIAGGADEQYRRAIKVTRPSGLPPYLVVATPLPRSSFLLRELIGDAATMLVQCVDPADQPQRAAEMLRQAFSLTSAETRVAALVGSGLGAPHIAMALGLTVNTVRTHIAHIFEKTGLRSQVALARLMASIADR